MKRLEALAPLSRDHHDALILAQLLKKDTPSYRNLPDSAREKAAYAKTFFTAKLRQHFDIEEAILESAKGQNDEIDLLIPTIIDEHSRLSAAFASLSEADGVEAKMDLLGKELEQHIRKEERVLFPLIQQYCSQENLHIIELLSHAKPAVMKKDIETKKDIELLVNNFYEKVREDEMIGHIFNDVAKVNWEKHLPVMYDFWENVLFYTGSYTGNPMDLHKHLHRVMPLNKDHFSRWENIFTKTIDELFEGEKARLAKQRAISISTVMQIKILDESSSSNKIY